MRKKYNQYYNTDIAISYPNISIISIWIYSQLYLFESFAQINQFFFLHSYTQRMPITLYLAYHLIFKDF